MRIAVVAPVWFPVPPTGYGGIELVVSLLADGLVDAGHDVTLFASGGSRLDGEGGLAAGRAARSARSRQHLVRRVPRAVGVPAGRRVRRRARSRGDRRADLRRDAARPPSRGAHAARPVDRPQTRLLYSVADCTCISSRSATRNAPTIPTSRISAPSTTASISTPTRTARKRTTFSSTSGARTPTRDRRRRSRSLVVPACRCR